jgi:hypothetical protein
MKQIKESPNKSKWPRHRVNHVECRKKDLVFRISDWTKDKDEPAYDVECYIGGVYDFDESKSFTVHSLGSPIQCRLEAIKFVQSQAAKLL